MKGKGTIVIELSAIFTFILFIVIIGGKFVDQTSANVSVQDSCFIEHANSRICEFPGLNLQQSIVTISKDFLILDSLPPNGSKTYRVKALEHSLLLLSLKADTTPARLKVQVEDSRSNATIEECYAPELSGNYVYYIKNESELILRFTNVHTNKVKYEFFVDASGPLKTNNSKSVPLTGGLVAFHVDLKKDDLMTLNLISPPSASFIMSVYTPHYRITGKISGYMLHSYTDKSNRTLSFTADLEGRYYIIIESVKRKGVFSLLSRIESPYWNRWWFWPAICVLAVAAITLWLIIKINMVKDLKKLQKHIIISDYCLFVTLTLWFSSIGAYLYRTPLLTALFFSSILSLGGSSGFRVYANYLRTKETSKVSNSWYLTSISFGIIFFFVCLFFFGFTFLEWWSGIGCLAGSIAAWIISKDVEKSKARNFLVFGIILAIVFPILVYLVEETVFQPFVIELYAPTLRSYIFRVASPYQTIPQGFILLYTFLAAGMIFLSINELKSLNMLASPKERGEGKSQTPPHHPSKLTTGCLTAERRGNKKIIHEISIFFPEFLKGTPSQLLCFLSMPK